MEITWSLGFAARILQVLIVICVLSGLAESEFKRASVEEMLFYNLRSTQQRTRTCPPCGTERWSIKTLSDREGLSIDIEKTETKTVHELVSLPRPARISASSRTEIEKKTFRVRARLVGYKLETDKDFHVVIRDLNNYKETMIVEIPSTECSGACTSPQRTKFNIARAAIVDMIGPTPTGKYKATSRPILVEVIGVGFFDAVRGQTGMAPNGIELHPVLSIKQVDSAR